MTCVAEVDASLGTLGGRNRLGLISKRLALAMGPSRPIDGYYFQDLHERVAGQDGALRRLDPECEWAVVALPAALNRSGRLAFMADHTGNIFAKRLNSIPGEFPDQPGAAGWTVVNDPEELEALQSGE